MNNTFKNVGSSPSGRYVVIGSVWSYPDLSVTGIRGNKKKHLLRKVELQGVDDPHTVGEKLTMMNLMVNGPATTVVAWEELWPFIQVCVEKAKIMAEWSKHELKPISGTVPEIE